MNKKGGPARFSGAVLSILAATACPVPAAAAVIYFNDFETSIGSEWSITAGGGALGIDNAAGRNFLGLADSLVDGGFGSNTVTLTLPLPIHANVTISFDYYGIRSLDGGFNCCGPDLFTFNVGTFTRTTSTGGPTQAYPNFIELGGTPSDNPAQFGNTGFFGNAVSFPFSFDVSDSSPTLTANFSMGIDQGVFDEGWGLDNVRVEVAAIPEPGTYILFLAGLSLIGWFSQHRQRVGRA